MNKRLAVLVAAVLSVLAGTGVGLRQATKVFCGTPIGANAFFTVEDAGACPTPYRPPPVLSDCAIETNATGCEPHATRVVTVFHAMNSVDPSTGFVFPCTGTVDTAVPKAGTSSGPDPDWTATGTGYPVLWRIVDTTVWNRPGFNITNGCNADNNTAGRVVTTGNLTSGSAAITALPDTGTIQVGDEVYAQNGTSTVEILPIARVVSKDSSSQVTVSQAAISTVPGARVVFSRSIDLILETRGDGVTFGTEQDAMKTNGSSRDINMTTTAIGIRNGPPQSDDKRGSVHQDGVQTQGGHNLGFYDFKVGNWADHVPTAADDGGAFFFSTGGGVVLTGAIIKRLRVVACNHMLHGTSGWGLVSTAWLRNGAPPEPYNGGIYNLTGTADGSNVITAVGGVSSLAADPDIVGTLAYTGWNSTLVIPPGTTITAVDAGLGTVTLSNNVPASAAGAHWYAPKQNDAWATASTVVRATGVHGLCNAKSGYTGPVDGVGGWAVANVDVKSLGYGQTYAGITFP